jgi:hypothetical protein
MALKLIFEGELQAIVFSTVVTAFIMEGSQLLKPDPQEVTVALLMRISQQLVSPSNASGIPDTMTSFSVSSFALRVNLLWYISLMLNFGCVLSGMLLKQWARTYIFITRPKNKELPPGAWHGHSLSAQQIHFLAVTILGVLHLSIFVFLVGVIAYLLHITSAIAYTTLGMFVVLAGLYVIATGGSMLFGRFPFGTPMSGFLRLIR